MNETILKVLVFALISHSKHGKTVNETNNHLTRLVLTSTGEQNDMVLFTKLIVNIPYAHRLTAFTFNANQ